MQAWEIMSRNVACCSPGTGLVEVARMMIDFDCGVIPVVDTDRGGRLLGVVTDN